MSGSFYPPILSLGFTGANAPTKSDSYNPGRRTYFENYRNEYISRSGLSRDWGSVDIDYTPHPSGEIYKNRQKYLTFPQSQITMLDAARQHQVDNFYMACQLHRDQYKDDTGTQHPLDYFKPSDVYYQCPKDPTSVYLKCPLRYARYKDPLVYPLTMERALDTPMLPNRALTGIYDKSSIVGRQ